MATLKLNVAIDMRTFAGYDFSTQVGSGIVHLMQGQDAWSIRMDNGWYDAVTGSNLLSA